MSKVIANTFRHTGATSDAITLDSSGNATINGNLDVTGTLGGLASIKKDLNVLALQTAVDTNRKAYNLQNSFIDQFEDETGIGTKTDTTVDDAEYVWAASLASDDTGGSAVSDIDGIAAYSGSFSVDTDSASGLEGTKFEAGSNRNFCWKQVGDNFLTGNYWVRFRPNHTWVEDDPAGGGWQIGIDYNDAAGYSGYDHNFYQLDDSNIYWMSSQGTDTSSTNQHRFYRDNAEITASRTQKAWSSGEDYYFVRSTAGSGSLKLYKGPYWIESNLLCTYADYSGTQGDVFTGGIGGPANEDTPDNTFTHINVAWKTGITTFRALAVSATGSIIGSANTASSSRTKVSGVILYKDASGTATIGTDLKIYFTCNGGTNWTEAASYTAGSDFSTGIKTIYLGETTCTAGTDVRYKAEWANQASGSKETQLHGIGVNY